MTNKFAYTITRSKRAKRINIKIDANNNVSVVVPFFVTKKQADKFVLEKQAWINKHLNREKTVIKISLSAKEDYKQNKEKARKLITEKVEFYSQIYGFKYKSISIRNQSSRWGSCSSKGSLNFSYKIIYLPEVLQNYLVVHELCHIKEHNHSKKFWELVIREFPKYKGLNKELKKYIFEYVL